MRNIYVIISVLLFSLAACQEKEIPGYSIERDGLQFDYDTNQWKSIDKSGMGVFKKKKPLI